MKAKYLYRVLFVMMFSVKALTGSEPTKVVPAWFAESYSNPQYPPFAFQYGNKSSAELLPGWKLTRDSQKMDDRRTLQRFVYTNQVTGMQVGYECIEYADFPALEWVLFFKNSGKKDTPILQDVQALDISIPSQSEDPVLHYARGAVCSLDDYQPLRRVLNRGSRVVLQPGGGRSSSDFLPFFNLEQAGNSGVMVAIGWSGEWQIQCATDSTRSTRIRSGMALTQLKLHPGEEIRSPRMALLFYQGKPMQGQNQLRRFILEHHRPTRNGRPFAMPLFVGTWGGWTASTHLASIETIIADDLPIDYYWIDAEWFGVGKWHQTAGDWRVKPDLYPQGFKPISERLHGSGRSFLLWFEPERICEGTPWYTELGSSLLTVPRERRFYNWGNSQNEPDWVLWESRRNQIVDNDRLFDFGNAKARKFLTDFISSLIDEFGIDCFRHDANIAPLEFWRAADAPDRQGMTEIRWIEGLYAFWDQLLQRHPGLIIDNCASGGRRIDLESLGRSTPFWRTDHPEEIIGRQCHTFGISSWVPLNATGAITPGQDNDYAFRSTFSSSMVVGLPTMTETEQSRNALADAKRMLQQYRLVQKYFLGDFYPLTCYSQAADAWMAWQFNRPDLEAGMVQVFRRPESISETGNLKLFGLDAGATYVIANQDAAGASEISGQSLMEQGLSVTLAERPAAAVLVYTKKR